MHRIIAFAVHHPNKNKGITIIIILSCSHPPSGERVTKPEK
jgi:hypothetical protein